MPNEHTSRQVRSTLSIAFTVVAALATPLSARADDPVVAKPPPYSLGWQLRPAAAVNVVRADTIVAGYHDANGDGNTMVTTLLGSYKVTSQLAPVVRLAVVHNTPSMGAEATSMSNPLIGLTWAPSIARPFKVGVLAAMTLPLGSGGGDDPDAAAAAANKAGAMARSSMDNAMFAVNDVGAITGVDVAYVDNGLTLQAEATIFELVRARGAMTQPDRTKTNFTSGVHAGYFVMPWLSVGGELRYQRYLSTPAFIAADTSGKSRDTLTTAIGVRGHIQLGGGRWLRPGVAYARGLDNPMSGRGYDLIQVDMPFNF